MYPAAASCPADATLITSPYFSKAVEVVFALKASKLWDLGSLGERLIITFLRPPARAAEEVGIFW
jgi:hypothetical protein